MGESLKNFHVLLKILHFYIKTVDNLRQLVVLGDDINKPDGGSVLSGAPLACDAYGHRGHMSPETRGKTGQTGVDGREVIVTHR